MPAREIASAAGAFRASTRATPVTRSSTAGYTTKRSLLRSTSRCSGTSPKSHWRCKGASAAADEANTTPAREKLPLVAPIDPTGPAAGFTPAVVPARALVAPATLPLAPARTCAPATARAPAGAPADVWGLGPPAPTPTRGPAIATESPRAPARPPDAESAPPLLPACAPDAESAPPLLPACAPDAESAPRLLPACAPDAESVPPLLPACALLVGPETPQALASRLAIDSASWPAPDCAPTLCVPETAPAPRAPACAANVAPELPPRPAPWRPPSRSFLSCTPLSRTPPLRTPPSRTPAPGTPAPRTPPFGPRNGVTACGGVAARGETPVTPVETGGATAYNFRLIARRSRPSANTRSSASSTRRFMRRKSGRGSAESSNGVTVEPTR